MTALAAAKAITKRDVKTVKLPVDGGSIIYLGGLVALNTAGYAVPASDAAGLRLVGVAVAATPGDAAAGKIDNTNGSDGDLSVLVESDVCVKVAATSITQAMVGTPMYVVDDQTIDDAAGSTNKLRAGVLQEFISTTSGWLYIPPFGVTSEGAPDFVSTEQTGTGSSQNVAHGLGVTPRVVIVTVSELPDAAAETGFDVAQGAHTSTNVVVTVTSTVKFFVYAWL